MYVCMCIYIYMSPDSGSLAPPNGMVPQAHALGNAGHGTIHTYMHACIHASIHPSIHTYRHTHTDIHTYLPTYLHTYIPTYLRTYGPTDLHTHAHTYMHACMHAYLPTYLHTSHPMHACIHTYIPNIPTYQHTTTTGHRGGTRRTIPHRPTGGGPWGGRGGDHGGGAWESWVIYTRIYLRIYKYTFLCMYIYIINVLMWIHNIYTYIYIYIYIHIYIHIYIYIYTCLASPLWGMNHYVPTEWWCVDLPYALPKYKVAISPANLIWHGRSRFSTPWNGGCLHIVYIIQNLDMFLCVPWFLTHTHTPYFENMLDLFLVGLPSCQQTSMWKKSPFAGWEWGLLGLLLIVIVDHSRKFPTKHK